MKWGEFQLDCVSDGLLWLDGGAMFGVVPKVLWQKKIAPDDRNRIPLATNCLLVRTPSRTILIDTGCGTKFSPKEIEIYSIGHESHLVEAVHALGVRPQDVDLVINTHFHFDHCGGNTRREDGKTVPTFPNATYVVRREEYEAANSPNERSAASYIPANWRPLEERGMLRLVDSDEEIEPGITLVHTPGHTQGHQSVKITSGGRTLFYIADLCPTSAHVPLSWIMAYDLFPLTTLAVRKRIYRQAAEENWLLFFEHDTDVLSGHLHEREGKYILQPQSWAGGTRAWASPGAEGPGTAGRNE